MPSVLFALSVCLSAAPQEKSDEGSDRWQLELEIRKQLFRLVDYGVFDYMEFQLAGDNTVILRGQVTTPTLKTNAASAVRRIKEVSKVVNNIEVLPPSPTDDRIRRAAYEAIFSKTGMRRYTHGASQSIHIIVKNGGIALFGVVDSDADRNAAYIAARGIPGTFEIFNNLKVEKN